MKAFHSSQNFTKLCFTMDQFICPCLFAFESSWQSGAICNLWLFRRDTLVYLYLKLSTHEQRWPWWKPIQRSFNQRFLWFKPV